MKPCLKNTKPKQTKTKQKVPKSPWHTEWCIFHIMSFPAWLCNRAALSGPQPLLLKEKRHGKPFAGSKGSYRNIQFLSIFHWLEQVIWTLTRARIHRIIVPQRQSRRSLRVLGKWASGGGGLLTSFGDTQSWRRYSQRSTASQDWAGQSRCLLSQECGEETLKGLTV